MTNFNSEIEENQILYINIIKNISELSNPNDRQITKLLQKCNNQKNIILSKSKIFLAYKYLKEKRIFCLIPNTEIQFNKNIIMKPTRSISGVTVIAVLTKPFPCPGKCIFCPTETDMPKSYISSEPGSQRALRNKFDPYLQTYNRLKALRDIGHPTDKLELIILGGTWSFYPKKYQVWFINHCLRAFNDFGKSKEIAKTPNEKKLSSQNTEIGILFEELGNNQKMNEHAVARCVGLSIETRPDYINIDEIMFLRKLGVTKVQLGVQSLSDRILQLNQRGHNTKVIRNAINLLRLCGFKILIHWMPNLFGSNVSRDKADYLKIFKTMDYRPDEIKIYPCSLIKNTKLFKYFKKGLWLPYKKDQLLEVLAFCLEKTPRYCRISRMVRDIPANEIASGNKLSNFRQIAEQYLNDKKIKIKEIRFNEVKGEIDKLAFKYLRYKTKFTQEYFLYFETPKNKIAGFLRLSLPIKTHISELKNSSLIRELHIYGKSLEIGDKKEYAYQHLGLGKFLIAKAFEISKKNKYEKISVISAIGTKDYYRKLDFSDGRLYQYKFI
jgi:elongator complex protein 3